MVAASAFLVTSCLSTSLTWVNTAPLTDPAICLTSRHSLLAPDHSRLSPNVCRYEPALLAKLASVHVHEYGTDDLVKTSSGIDLVIR